LQAGETVVFEARGFSWGMHAVHEQEACIISTTKHDSHSTMHDLEQIHVLNDHERKHKQYLVELCRVCKSIIGCSSSKVGRFESTILFSANPIDD